MPVPKRITYRDAKGRFSKATTAVRVEWRSEGRLTWRKVTKRERVKAISFEKRFTAREETGKMRLSGKNWSVQDAYSGAGLGRKLRNVKGDLRISFAWHHAGETRREKKDAIFIAKSSLEGLDARSRKRLITHSVLQQMRALGIKTTRRKKDAGLAHASVTFDWALYDEMAAGEVA